MNALKPLDIKKLLVDQFIGSKRRPPKDMYEFSDWLLELDALLLETLQRQFDAFFDYVSLDTRTMVFPPMRFQNCPCGQGIDSDGDGNCPACAPKRKHQQTSGGVCRKCGAFTTYARQNSELGLCMKCENIYYGRQK